MIKLYMKLKAPLSHGDPALSDDTGNFRALRKQHIVGVGDVPVVSGNAIRGVMRRLVMRHFLAAAGMAPDGYANAPGHWDRIYAVMANGGTLTGSEKSVQTQRLREVRAACPPLSLLGSALYTYMLPGMIAVMDAYPQCRELAEVGFTDPSSLGISDLYGDRNHVRLISPEIDKEAAGITPMPYTHEILYPGAVIQGGIIIDRAATEIERDCLAWILLNLNQVGGNIGKGMGLVEITASDEIGSPNRYESWIFANATAARPILEAAIPARSAA